MTSTTANVPLPPGATPVQIYLCVDEDQVEQTIPLYKALFNVSPTSVVRVKGKIMNIAFGLHNGEPEEIKKASYKCLFNVGGCPKDRIFQGPATDTKACPQIMPIIFVRSVDEVYAKVCNMGTVEALPDEMSGKKEPTVQPWGVKSIYIQDPFGIRWNCFEYIGPESAFYMEGDYDRETCPGPGETGSGTSAA